MFGLEHFRNKHASKRLGGHLVPFLETSYLSAFGLPSDAFDMLKAEPMYALCDCDVRRELFDIF